MKKVSRRDLLTMVAVAPLMTAVGKPIKPKPKIELHRFSAWFKYYTRESWFSDYGPKLAGIVRKP